jgi:hypothetical protein
MPQLCSIDSKDCHGCYIKKKRPADGSLACKQAMEKPSMQQRGGKKELSMNFLCDKSFVQNTISKWMFRIRKSKDEFFSLREIGINMSENFLIFQVSLDFKV